MPGKQSKAKKRNARRQAGKRVEAQQSSPQQGAAVSVDLDGVDRGEIFLNSEDRQLETPTTEPAAASGAATDVEAPGLVTALANLGAAIGKLQGDAKASGAVQGDSSGAAKPRRRAKCEQLWATAVHIAEVEMQGEFVCDDSCQGGKLLYKREEQTKARRMHARLKERERVRQRKLAGAQCGVVICFVSCVW